MPALAADDLRNLPIPDLALALLRTLGDTPNTNNTLRGLEHRFHTEADVDHMLDRAASAWAWLESHALLGPHTRQTDATWRAITEMGHELRNDPAAVTKVWAADRLAGTLDPALSAARTNFALGEYEVAAFAALKEVEVRVRDAARLPNEVVGVQLMRKAFNNGGPLSDPQTEGGERQATADLFAGAIGLFKNPASHRAVSFDDPTEAAEVIQLADLLLRIVHRAEARTAAPR